MKRGAAFVLTFTTLFLVALVVIRRVGDKTPAPSQELVNLATQAADSFSKVKTKAMDVEEFGRTLDGSAGATLGSLTASERTKLLDCVRQFYDCYSTGNYLAFKRWRFPAASTISQGLADAARKTATQRGLELKSDDDLLKFCWETYNGTNKITGVDGESIRISIVTKNDLGADLRRTSHSKWPQLGTPMCWEGAIIHEPSPVELLKQDGALRFFALEALVRFNHIEVGPATPIVLIGYWDSKRGDWMPMALCVMFRVKGYDTMF